MTNQFLGNLFIISAASGTGKTSLVKEILAHNKDISISISHTTRLARLAEIEGKDYFFVTERKFKEMQADEAFFESAECHGSFYGTSKESINQIREAGKDIILEIDWQGAVSIKAIFPEAVSIFILPPSMEKLEERLRARGQDSEQTIIKRLAAARSEMSHIEKFDYVTIN
jgi:guanylate kinase